MSRDFDQLVDRVGIEPVEDARLRHIHDLLVAVGPPPELSVALREAPTPWAAAAPTAAAGPVASVVSLAAFRSRRRPRFLVLAATVAAACFGGGYLIATQAHGSSGDQLSAARVVALQGSQRSLASLRVGQTDQHGNLPIELTVNGLPKLTNPRSYYILMLVDRKGRPGALCGMFKVDAGTTSVRFSVPYRVTPSTRWVVTAVTPGVHWPGHVVMTTT